MPLTPASLGQEPLHVMRANRSLEAVEENQHGSIGGCIEMMQVQKVAVGCLKAIDPCIVDALAPKKFCP